MADEKSTRPRAQSSELGAGTGFTFEDAVGAFFLTALLSEGYAPGIEDRIVRRVSFQRKTFGEPLDDLIIDFTASDGNEARLSLQAKRSLTISAATSNEDFREVIANSWRTFRKDTFRRGMDRVGVAVGEVSRDRSRAFETLCQAARASIETDDFMARFADGGNASADVRSVKDDIETVLRDVAGGGWSDADLHQFLASLVLIHFDFLHSGAVDPPAAMTSLRACLTAGSADRAPDLWASLCQTVRNSAGESGQYDRPRLIRQLSTTFPLVSAQSLRPDIVRLTNLANDWAMDISNDVGGAHLERKTLGNKLAERLTQSRFVQITGLPGSGKSAVLRQQLESDLTRGPVLFLKSDRLEGRGWVGFANHYGLTTRPLVDLLVEIAAIGTATVYIDGIDRIEKAHQAIILDVLRTIFGASAFDNWRVVATLRDTGIEPLRNWLGDVLDKNGVRTIDVSALDDDEAEELAKAKPQLRGLLFGPTPVQDIVRRPFFAKIMAQAYGSAATEAAFEPQSEIDLIENWWQRGGYNSSGQEALNRRRALIELAGAQARHVSQAIRFNELSPQTVDQIDQLTADGLIRTVRTGLSVRFAHDILFEWAFYYLLSDQEPQWPDAIRACGEPPAVARAVELLSQYEFREGKIWSASLTRLSESRMRAQWTRAWLLGPVASDIFSKDEAQFEVAVYANDLHFLQKALVWFQAEKTTPNPNVLADTLSRDEKIRLADTLSWPSDFPSWRRLLVFVLKRLAHIPVRMYPDVVSVFEVWQNACAGIPNSISSAIVAHCGAWLSEIDSRGTEEGARQNSRWDEMKDAKEFRQALIAILAYGARTVPKPSGEYLQRLIGLEPLRDERFSEVIVYSPLLAGVHSSLLVDLTLKHLKDELPDDQVSRVNRERSERKGGGFSYLDFPQFSMHDWSRLSIDHDVHNFWPASPLREPFRSLFKESPDDAIRLLRELCNHAITSWQQLHRHVRDTGPPGTPLPLIVNFPWGVQEFWGTEREYIWYRGMAGPNELECGLFALEEWCFSELQRGTSVDDIIRRIVEGNECIAVLGIAVLLVLHTNRVSETVFALITAQRLWAMDHYRTVQDVSGGIMNLAGFTKKSDLPHAQSLQALNARPARKQQLRWLAQLYVLNGEFGERTRAAIASFKGDLPFQYEEQKGHAPSRERLTKQAAEYGELADLTNYQIRRVPDSDNLVEIQVASPSAEEPENVKARQNAVKYLQLQNLHIWSSKVLDDGRIDDRVKYDNALSLARQFDSTDLFLDTSVDEEVELRRSAVSGAAAVVLKYREGRDDGTIAWARDAVDRAWGATDIRSQFWSPQSIIPWEPKIFVARGLGADIRHGTAAEDTPETLLALVAHALEIASLAALQEAAKLWDVDSKLAWAAMLLAFDLCRLHPPEDPERYGPRNPLHSTKRVEEALEAAINYYRSDDGWAILPTPPPAWVESEAARQRRSSPSEDYDLDDMEDARKDWVEPRIHWYSQYAAKVLQNLPLEQILASDAKEVFLTFFAEVLQWTNDKNAPPWVKKGRRNKGASRLFEWTHTLGATLGRLLGLLPLAETKPRLLDPVLRLEGDVCWSLLSPLVSTYICRYIYDAATIPGDALPLLNECLERFIASPTFKASSYNSGRFYGMDEPRLLETLMFVSVERANGAARFVNGDWSAIDAIMPVIDRLVRAGGWASMVMYHFLLLCERARDHYPAEAFADQILSILENPSAPPKGWKSTSNAARIAGLIQHFASRETPMPKPLGLKLLRVLDFLIDMGDRRSAALELSEVFREISDGAM